MILEVGDLAVGQRVLDGNGHLAGNLQEELHFVAGERAFPDTREIQTSQRSLAADQRQATNGPDAFLVHRMSGRVTPGDFAGIQHHGLACSEGHIRRRVFAFWDRFLLLDESMAAGKVKSVVPEPAAFRIRQSHTHQIALHHLPHAGRDGPQQIAQLEV